MRSARLCRSACANASADSASSCRFIRRLSCCSVEFFVSNGAKWMTLWSERWFICRAAMCVS